MIIQGSTLVLTWTVKHNPYLVWLLWVVNAVVGNIPHLALLHIRLGFLCITLCGDTLNKTHIIIMIFLVSNLHFRWLRRRDAWTLLTGRHGRERMAGEFADDHPQAAWWKTLGCGKIGDLPVRLWPFCRLRSPFRAMTKCSWKTAWLSLDFTLCTCL